MLTGWLFGVQLSTVGPCLAGQRTTVRLYLYHTRYVLSFLSFGPSSGGVECPLRLCRGCVRMLMGIPVGLCFTTGRGRVAGGWGQQPDDVREVGFISPVGIAWSL